MFRFVLFAALLFAAPAVQAQTVKGTDYRLTEGPRDDPALTQEIVAADKALFDAFFVACDIEKLGTLLTDDVSFVHDKWGKTADSKAELVAAFRGTCERQAAGTDFRSRRELVVESVEVHPLNNYGALEMGEHRFYALIPGQPEQLTEVSRFIILWQKVGGVWKMAETISYGHKLTAP
jgi:ketosteroid isomerase-like protein